LQVLAAHGVKVTFQAFPGMHEYKVWRQGLHAVAPLLFKAGKS
jgi:enterochelin esterase-like enzyme